MKTILFIVPICFCVASFAQKQPNSASKKERLQIAIEMEKSMNAELLDKWYPQCTDSIYGGFISTYSFDFKPIGTQDKFIVTQARHTWTTAKAAALFPDKKYFIEASKNGYHFLRDIMWDKQYGGFYNLVTRQGIDKSNPLAPKEAYGNAFAIYALAAYYKTSKDSAALSLAKKAFRWLEKNSHDPIYKGYYQHLNRDGSIIVRNASFPPSNNLGYKDQNSSIHLLEAFTELYSVWPDPLLKERLKEMLLLIRDKITTPKGNLILFFTPNWTPVSFRDSVEAVILKNKNLDHVSFGHDVETAFLMMEASQELGIKMDNKTLIAGKKMVDHALRNGWDKSMGGFYDEGYYFKNRDSISIIFDSKNWWAQAEGLNTLLMMADYFPNDTMQYYEKFKQLWNYIQIYMIDHVNGDWYEEGLDKEPQRVTALKGHIWKGTYHSFRALSNCIQRLRSIKLHE